tara:strand:+ start:69 stop:461 length:393 start_codon:yes stop_codon:yes gene_type:complete
MIQRIQTLFFFLSAVFLIIIVFCFPILKDEKSLYFLTESFSYARLCIFTSAALSIFAVFQFRDRKKQLLISSISRLMITIAVLLIVFLYRQDRIFAFGMLLLIIPFILLILANVFIKKDENLVKSADRIR